MHVQSTNSWGRISRTQLRRCLFNTRADLTSKGTIDDPIGRRVGCTLDRLTRFEHQLEQHPQATLAEIQTSIAEDVKDSSRASTRALIGLAASAGLALAAATIPLVPAVALGMGCVAAVGGILSVANYAAESFRHDQHQRTADELATWGQAFADFQHLSLGTG